ncbi:MAG: helix-turn-helix domain-containing protein [Clostridia bacterium]|nr:helix-turn-helix domain-containing protein [Clostridia bacterium]
MEKRSEEALVKLAQSGDKQSVETLLENYKNLVRCIARRVRGSCGH